MFATLCALLALSANAPELPRNARTELAADGIELVLRATATHFAALNPGERPLLLHFFDASSGTDAQFVLAPRGEAEFRFASGALDRLELEVLVLDHGRLLATNPIALAAVEEPEVDALWIKRNADQLSAFAQVGNSFREIATDARRIDRSSSAVGGAGFCVMPHVPVITPARHGGADKPPKLEKYVPPF